jgi:hypothetical protein
MLLALMLLPLILVIFGLVIGVMLAIGSFHAYSMSLWNLLKSNQPGVTLRGEVLKIAPSMILLSGLVVGGVGALGAALRQVSIILTGQCH